jgi:hypothetical protein
MELLVVHKFCNALITNYWNIFLPTTFIYISHYIKTQIFLLFYLEKFVNLRLNI